MSAVELRAAADEALLWQVIKTIVEERYKAARAAAEAAMREARSERQRVLDTDEADLGTLSISEPKWTAQVTDLDALLRWVKRNRPDELESHVRSSFIEALKGGAIARAKAGEGEGAGPVDRETGAIIPGVEAVYDHGGLRVLSTHEAKRRMTEILDGLFGDVLAVDAGDQRALEGAHKEGERT